MRYKYPHYYKDFSCVAQECEATCCAGWEIVIDDDTIGKYLDIRTEFGNRLCNSIDFKEGVFHQDGNKRCAFLNDENLCDIYSEIGEEYLCYTCERYPRHIEEFEDVNEVSLSISCPEIAKMILAMQEKVTFYEEKIEEEIEEFEDFDFIFYEMLYEMREIIYEILQKREININIRMQVVAEFVGEVQKKIDEYALFEVDTIITKYKEINLASVKMSSHTEKSQYEVIQEYINHLYRLEVLQEGWHPTLKQYQKNLYQMEYDVYQEHRRAFHDAYGIQLELMKEQLMIYFVYSYFCGAVYDGEVQSKYLLAYVTTYIIEELWFAKYLENDGALSEQDFYRIVYQYAREIEHSDQNLETLEELYREETVYRI